MKKSVKAAMLTYAISLGYNTTDSLVGLIPDVFSEKVNYLGRDSLSHDSVIPMRKWVSLLLCSILILLCQVNLSFEEENSFGNISTDEG